MTLYIDNSNVIELRELKNSVTGAADTGASVSVTVKDSAGDDVAGETWPVSLAHASGGTYRGTLSRSLTLTEGGVYTAVVSVTGSGAETATFNCRLRAEERRCS